MTAVIEGEDSIQLGISIIEAMKLARDRNACICLIGYNVIYFK